MQIAYIPWSGVKFIVYGIGEHKIAHIKLPEPMKPLFMCGDSEALCGNNSVGRRVDSYTEREVTYYESVPDGFRLCKYCYRAIINEIMPLLED